MNMGLPLALRTSAIWIAYGVWSSVTGWVLTMVGQLNPGGYAGAAVPLLLVAGWLWHCTGSGIKTGSSLRLHACVRRPGFVPWVIVATLAFCGGLVHAPTNYDALTYRIPRLFYWLQEGHWFWIEDASFRLNIAATGFEWLSAPLVLLTRGDRWLFLLNQVSFLLLPALFFIAARGLGIGGREARWWMWIAPCAYGLVLQSASIGNDLPGAFYFLASVAFTSRARQSHTVLCLGLSALSAVLLTGLKVSNLPLGLPLFIYWVANAWQLLPTKRILVLGAGLAPLALGVSFLPIAFACSKHTGVWSGNPDNRHQIELSNPLAGLAGNFIDYSMGALQPPLLPGSRKIDTLITDKLDTTTWYPWMQESYPRFRITSGGEMPSEEYSGIGLGITLAAIAYLISGGSLRSWRRKGVLLMLFTLGVLLSAAVFFAKVGGGATARLMLPWTPAILLVVAAFGSARRFGSSHLLASMPAVMIFPALLLNPNRPLIPSHMIQSIPAIPAGVRERMLEVYRVYDGRNDLLKPFRELIPDDANVGFAGGEDHSSASLFRPLRRIKVIEVGTENLDKVDWIVGTKESLAVRLGATSDLAEFEEYRSSEITSKVSKGAESWLLLHRIGSE